MEFIGKPYKCKTPEETEKKKNEILSEYDLFQIEKLTFLNECQDNENTIKSYWVLYNNNVHYDERNKGKDISLYSTSEIEDVISSAYGLSSTRSSLGSFLKAYCAWKLKRGDININPFDGININELKKNQKNVIKKKVYGLKRFHELCENMLSYTRLPNVIPLVLARYGIMGEQLVYMRNLKWEAIDRNKKVVYIKNDKGEILRELPIDDKFINWIDMMKDYEDSQSDKFFDGKKNIIYIDNGYVLKKIESKDNDEIITTYAGVCSRAYTAFESNNLKAIGFNDLLKSRQLDYLLDIRKNRRLTMEDFNEVVELYSLEENPRIVDKAFNLKKRYEELTSDKVITAYNKRKICDGTENDNSFEIYEKIVKELSMEK